jgi:hypothetical protein
VWQLVHDIEAVSYENADGRLQGVHQQALVKLDYPKTLPGRGMGLPRFQARIFGLALKPGVAVSMAALSVETSSNS